MKQISYTNSVPLCALRTYCEGTGRNCSASARGLSIGYSSSNRRGSAPPKCDKIRLPIAAPELPLVVFRTNFLQMSRRSKNSAFPLVLPCTFDRKVLLDQLADFLWEHRDIGENFGKEKDN